MGTYALLLLACATGAVLTCLPAAGVMAQSTQDAEESASHVGDAGWNIYLYNLLGIGSPPGAIMAEYLRSQTASLQLPFTGSSTPDYDLSLLAVALRTDAHRSARMERYWTWTRTRTFAEEASRFWEKLERKRSLGVSGCCPADAP